MKRIKALNRYQKGILIVLAAMIVVFCMVYSIATSKVGFLYENAILQPSQQDGNTVYSGKIDGKEAVFTVTADKEITYRLGNTVYGPYTVKEDPTAIPKDHPFATGFEIKKGDKILFRGGVYPNDSGMNSWMMFNEDGIPANGFVNILESHEPSTSTLLTLYHGPALTHKGNWSIWFVSVFASILTAISVLFPDEMFRWRLRYQIRDAERAEPSDWELFTRHTGWLIMVIVILVLYINGLQ